MEHILKKPHFFSNKSGFTLIELLIVMLIIALISSASFAIIKRFNSTQSLGVYYENMKNDINFAKSSAFSQVVKNCKSTGSGPPMIFEGYSFIYDRSEESYRIEEECSPDIVSDEDRIVKSVELPADLNLHFTGANPRKIIFKPLGGGTDLGPNSVDIELRSLDGERSRVIKVYRSGVIE